MIEQLQESLKEFDEKMPKMIVDLVWSITDGGCKLKESQCLTYQDEPIREFEDIKHFLITHTISILEAEVKHLESELEIQLKVQKKAKEVVVIGRARVMGMVADKYTRIGKIEMLKDQINYLNEQITKIKEM